MSIAWGNAAKTLEGFGGSERVLRVSKTGLPFFDALRLYGAIDLYIGLREDVAIHDCGGSWEVIGRCRVTRIAGKDQRVYRVVRGEKKNPTPDSFCRQLFEATTTGLPVSKEQELTVPATKELTGLDAILQAGIRNVSAARYDSMQTGQTSESTCCVLRIPLSDGVLAFAGKKRVEPVGNVVFLPIFEGRVDLAKIVSPLRVWFGRVPNVSCAQAIALLALKVSLYSEGYEDRLTGVAFNTQFDARDRDNCSGLVTIESTAVGRMTTVGLVDSAYRLLRQIVSKAWDRKGSATEFVADALGMTYWLMQPVPKHLGAFIVSQERMHRFRMNHLLEKPSHVLEVFSMSYGYWKGDIESVRKFAKAVASGIYHARMKKEAKFEDRSKNWYDEVTILRSTSSPSNILPE